MGTITLCNDFELLEELRGDDVFHWWRGRCISSGEPILLQMLSAPRPEKIYTALEEYFAQLQVLARFNTGILAPWMMLKERPNYPLVMVYADADVTPLETVLRQPATEMMGFWSEAAELLHALHAKNMLHGNLSLPALGQRGAQVVLREFGYAPLLAEQDQQALSACKYKSPELLIDQRSSRASDTFAFAKTLIACHKELRSYAWNDRATNARAEKRYQKIRELIQDLANYLDTISGTPEDEALTSGATDCNNTVTQTALGQTQQATYSPYILGIELGMSNSAVAVSLRRRTQVIEIDGQKTCPGVLRMLPDGRMLAGRAAKAGMLVDPDNSAAFIKRHLGSDTEESRRLFPREFPARKGVQYRPEDLTAEILAKLVSAAQQNEQFDWRGTLHYAVICVPAGFTSPQREALKEAARLAGLEVLDLLEEPVAAASYYYEGSERYRDQTMLIYDLGGSTFDVTIMEVKAKVGGSAAYSVLAKDGLSHLGGDDFDLEIMKLAAAQLQQISQINILDLDKDWGVNKRKLREAQQKLKEQAEAGKIELSCVSQTSINIPDIITDETGTSFSLEMVLTIDQFNEAIRPFVLQTKDAVEAALRSARLDIEQIDRIVLVGGSSRVPLVKTMLKEMFGIEPYADLDPDTVMARGAAMTGASLYNLVEKDATADICDEDAILCSPIDTVSHYLGIEQSGGRFCCLLEKGTEIPIDASLSVSHAFTTQRDNQAMIRVSIFQADHEVQFVTEEGVTFIDEIDLPVPPRRRGEECVTVTFTITRENVLQVSATGSTGDEGVQIIRENSWDERAPNSPSVQPDQQSRELKRNLPQYPESTRSTPMIKRQRPLCR